MKWTMVRYKVKPDRAAENEGFIRRVLAQLAAEQPPGIRYRTLKGDDGVTFVHIAAHDSPDDPNPLTELASFKAFTAGIKDRCDEPPVSVKLNEIASYDSRA